MQVKLKSIHEIIPKYDHFVFDMDGVFVLYSPNLVDRKSDYRVGSEGSAAVDQQWQISLFPHEQLNPKPIGLSR